MLVNLQYVLTAGNNQSAFSSLRLFLRILIISSHLVSIRAMTRIELYLDPGVGGTLCYFPGQLLKGKVQLHLTHTKTCRSFHVTIYGKARAHWKVDDKHHTKFEGTEVYINNRFYLFGQKGGPTIEKPPGVYEFMLQFQLPEDLPPTLFLKHAEINYYIEAVLDIPWKFDDESKMAIRVLPNIDLNLYDGLSSPEYIETHKTTYAWFCKTGKIYMTVTIPYSGFAIGQRVPVKISYNNTSTSVVTGTKMILKRVIQYFASSPYRKRKEKTESAFAAHTDGVRANSSITFETKFDIPQETHITLASCNVVKIDYFMVFEAVVDGFHKNFKAIFPVAIGTKPIIVAQPEVLPQAPPPQPALTSNESPAPTAEPSAPDLPPSFDEVVHPQSPPLTSNKSPSPIPTVEPSAPNLPPSFEEAMRMPSTSVQAANVPVQPNLTENPTAGNIGWSL
ncbi:arrestin domain-containing protein 2-like [Chironomus tepperi]|uniref:arrestin domain-containing protein 2-like n=1 Tax=Chironomus tepperi TaxID=113505 RepID=UPI00391F71AC